MLPEGSPPVSSRLTDSPSAARLFQNPAFRPIGSERIARQGAVPKSTISRPRSTNRCPGSTIDRID